MNSPFQKKFMSKSPLRSHGRRLKKLDKKIAKADTYDKGGDKDYDYLADLQRQRKDLVASHTDTSTKRTEEEDVQVREDEDAAQGSAVEMESPLHGYVDASDMVDPNPPTAHMWTKVFDAASDAYKSAITPEDPCEGLTGDSLAKCKNAQYEAKSEDTSTPKQETSAEALTKVKKEHEEIKAGWGSEDLKTKSIDGKFVKVDKDGNVVYKMSKGEGANWVHVDDIQEF